MHGTQDRLFWGVSNWRAPQFTSRYVLCSKDSREQLALLVLYVEWNSVVLLVSVFVFISFRANRLQHHSLKQRLSKMLEIKLCCSVLWCTLCSSVTVLSLAGFYELFQSQEHIFIFLFRCSKDQLIWISCPQCPAVLLMSSDRLSVAVTPPIFPIL